jgi:hypothetical protein
MNAPVTFSIVMYIYYSHMTILLSCYLFLACDVNGKGKREVESSIKRVGHTALDVEFSRQNVPNFDITDYKLIWPYLTQPRKLEERQKLFLH